MTRSLISLPSLSVIAPKSLPRGLYCRCANFSSFFLQPVPDQLLNLPLRLCCILFYSFLLKWKCRTNASSRNTYTKCNHTKPQQPTSSISWLILWCQYHCIVELFFFFHTVSSIVWLSSSHFNKYAVIRLSRDGFLDKSHNHLLSFHSLHVSLFLTLSSAYVQINIYILIPP